MPLCVKHGTHTMNTLKLLYSLAYLLSCIDFVFDIATILKSILEFIHIHMFQTGEQVYWKMGASKCKYI